MKYRLDFVTNSSSSSYICELCHDVEAGMDLSIYDTEMIECEMGHCLCKHHLIREEVVSAFELFLVRENEDINHYLEEHDQFLKFRTMDMDDLLSEMCDESDLFDFYAWPKEACPICNVREVPDYKLLDFMIRNSGFTKNKIIENYKREFQEPK